MEGNGSGTTSAVLRSLSDVVCGIGGEVELLIETAAAVTGCLRSGWWPARTAGGPVLVRDLPICGRPTLLV